MWKKVKTDPLRPPPPNQFQMDFDKYKRYKNKISFLKVNIRKYLHAFSLGIEFLNMTQDTNHKNRLMNYIKINNGSSKTPLEDYKR